jgi:deferrochelatase/peroxidase EfeB
VSAVELDDLQALLRSALRTLPHARYALYHLPAGADGRRFLATLVEDVTSAADRDASVATQVALTATGLAGLGVPSVITDGFSDEFLAGMIRRSRFLGDTPEDWRWGRGDQDSVDLLVITYAATAELLATTVHILDERATAVGVVPVDARETHGSTGARPVALGEFVLGHPNAYGLVTQRPVLPRHLDPQGLLPVLPAGADRGYPDGGADLGRNGTYLVLRTLAQDVAAFDTYVAATAGELGLDPELLDVRGLRCPLGAHVRRANPRDALDPRPGSDASQAVTDRHRLLRRGRVFADDGEQGLQFVALNANLGRQFEFVQHSWLNDPKFAGLTTDLDPLVTPRTPDGVFTIPDEPFRTRVCGLPEFVTTLGGAYFFLPGRRALRYLASGGYLAAGSW